MSEKTEDLQKTQKDTEQDARIIVQNGNAESKVVGFLDGTLNTLTENQQSILNSQAANRELLGVIIQDNFNLKEENKRLRQRVLELEKSVAKLGQADEARYEALRREMDAKIAAAHKLATEAVVTANSVEMPHIETVEGKSGCLGFLFGGGGTQVVTAAPKRSKGETAAERASKAGPASPPTPSTPPAHPKPTFPPE